MYGSCQQSAGITPWYAWAAALIISWAIWASWLVKGRIMVGLRNPGVKRPEAAGEKPMPPAPLSGGGRNGGKR
jgi:hypothetical protein